MRKKYENLNQKTFSVIRSTLRYTLPPSMYYYLRDIFVPGEVFCCYKTLNKIDGNKVMIDVGAHVGGSLIKFAQEGWRVYAFEPDNVNRERLKTLCKKVSLKNVTIDSRAVSDKPNTNISFYRSNLSSGISGLSEFDGSHKESQKVDTITLSVYCSNENINKVDFLKIDTEGYDLNVLKGFPFKSIRPKVILTEFENSKTIPLGYDFNDLVKYLVNKGYSVAVSEWYPVVQYGGNHKFRNISHYPCELIDENATGNLIACQDKKILNDIVENIKKHL